MLRILAILALLCSTAAADDKADVEKLVRRLARAVSTDGVAKSAQILVDGAPSFEPVAFTVDKLRVELVSVPGTPVAWFHGTGKVGASGIRVNGLATDDKGWKVVAIAFSTVTPDAQLLERANKAAKKLVPPASPKLLGDKDAAACVAQWFGPHKLADGLGAGDELVIASGTSEPEHAEGRKTAPKLVASWDALKLRPVEIEAKVHNGVIWARALVGMPIAGQKHMAPLVLTAVAANAGMGCVWYSLHWADHTRAYK